MERIKIGNRWVGKGEPCFITCDIGQNHQGDVDIAKKMIDVAFHAGVDAVKFQKRSVDKILTKKMLDSPYENPNSFGKTYGEHRRALEFDEKTYADIKKYCLERKINFFASVWDEESADVMERIGVPAFKIASSDLINIPLVEHVAVKGKPIILSTGMSNLNEVEEAVNAAKKYNDQIILLQCVSAYPCEHKDINLKVMELLKKKFDVVVGYSGHERGLQVTLAAVSLGASVIERHFTLDSTAKGTDHAASLEPPGLFKLVRDIRIIEEAMGKEEKTIVEATTPNRIKLAKSLVAKVPIKRGVVITKEMLTIKSPGNGLPPKYVYSVPGKVAKKDIPEDTIITEEDVE